MKRCRRIAAERVMFARRALRSLTEGVSFTNQGRAGHQLMTETQRPTAAADRALRSLTEVGWDTKCGKKKGPHRSQIPAWEVEALPAKRPNRSLTGPFLHEPRQDGAPRTRETRANRSLSRGFRGRTGHQWKKKQGTNRSLSGSFEVPTDEKRGDRPFTKRAFRSLNVRFRGKRFVTEGGCLPGRFST